VATAAATDGNHVRGKGPEKRTWPEKQFVPLREREKQSEREKPIAVAVAAVAVAAVAAAAVVTIAAMMAAMAAVRDHMHYNT